MRIGRVEEGQIQHMCVGRHLQARLVPAHPPRHHRLQLDGLHALCRRAGRQGNVLQCEGKQGADVRACVEGCKHPRVCRIQRSSSWAVG